MRPLALTGDERARPETARALHVCAIEAPVAPPGTLFAARPDEPAFAWSAPGGPACAGLGAAWEFTPAGPARFVAAESAAEAVLHGLEVAGGSAPFIPALFAGFAFAPGAAASAPWTAFADGLLMLPRWTYSVAGGRAHLALCADEPLDAAKVAARGRGLLVALDRAPRAPEDPAPAPRVSESLPLATWTRLVEDARAAIAAGTFDKVVLARRTRLLFDSAPAPAEVLARLRALHPGAYVFALRRGGVTFLGASPETLVARRGGTVLAEALAGTAAREQGPDALAGSPKDLAEHRLVLDGIRDALAPLCSAMTSPPVPEVRALRDVYHLCSPVRGTLRENTPLLRLVGALHPTPATGGHPGAPALAWIAAHEPAARGWYAGPIGLLDARGDGAFAVAIRSALLADAEASVYAGAGIVAGSDPGAEFAEVAAKERAVRAALGAL